MGVAEILATVDYDDVSCEDGAWCSIQPPHDGRWFIPTGETDEKFNCPVVEMYCEQHMLVFFVGLSEMLR